MEELGQQKKNYPSCFGSSFFSYFICFSPLVSSYRFRLSNRFLTFFSFRPPLPNTARSERHHRYLPLFCPTICCLSFKHDALQSLSSVYPFHLSIGKFRRLFHQPVSIYISVLSTLIYTPDCFAKVIYFCFP